MFAEHTTQTNLRRIYTEHVEHQQFRGRDGTSPDALRGELKAICRLISYKVRHGHYRFTQYVEQLKSKGANKNPRIISIPTARDRVVLRALSDCLVQVFPHASGVIPQVRVRELTEELKRGRFDSFVKIDIQDFYPSIDHDVLRRSLAQRIRTPALLQVVMEAVRTPTVPPQHRKQPASHSGVPQGLAISNVLSEIVISPVDNALTASEGVAYFRFVDDILMLCDQSDINRVATLCLDSLAGQGLSGYELDGTNGKSRSGSLEEEFEYLGYRFNGPNVSVRETSIHALETRLANEFTKYRARQGNPNFPAARVLQNKVNLAITGCIWNRTAYGWLSYFRQLNDLTLLKKLDRTVANLATRHSVPSSVQFKSFMRAYWAISHPNGKDAHYIPDFDNLSISQMRDRLVDFMSEEEVASLSDHAVPRVFRKLIARLTSELQRDIGDLS